MYELTWKGNRKYYTIVIILFLIWFIIHHWIYTFFYNNSPPMLRYPLAGTTETALMYYQPIDFINTDNKNLSSYGVTIKDMPTDTESDRPTEMALMFWLRPDNVSHHKQEKNVKEPYLLNKENNRTTTVNHQYVTKFHAAPILTQGSNSFQVLYDSFTNSLILRIKTLFYGKNGQERQFQEFKIFNILKIQRWNMILINIKDRHLDLYFDGKLHESYLLKNVPIIRNNTFTFFNYDNQTTKFYGVVSCARFFNFSLNYKDAKALYNKYKNQMHYMNAFWYWYWPQQYRPVLLT